MGRTLMPISSACYTKERGVRKIEGSPIREVKLHAGAGLVPGRVSVPRNGLVGDVDTDDAGLRLAARDGKRHASLKNFRSRCHEKDPW